MNNCFTKLCLLITILSSCTKANFTNELVPSYEISEPEIISNQYDVYPDRIVPLNPPFVSMICGFESHTPAVIIPAIHVNQGIELIFAKVLEYEGEAVKPKAIKWQVNGETILQLTSQLMLPYETGHYDFNVVVTLINGNQLNYDFGLNVTNDMVLHNGIYLNDFFCPNCLTILSFCCSNPSGPSFICPYIE